MPPSPSCLTPSPSSSVATSRRCVLLIEHARPGTRLIVTVFDATIAAQLRNAIINCEVTSPAETSIPALVGACLGPGMLAVDPGSFPIMAVRSGPQGAELGTLQLRAGRRRLAGQLRSHDTTARVLLIGAAGLGFILVTDWLIVLTVLHLRAATAVYAAVRVVATVGPGDATSHAPTGISGSPASSWCSRSGSQHCSPPGLSTG